MPSIIGPIIRLQIQRAPLKVGEKGAKRYLTEPIASVPQLRLTGDGITILEDRGETLDVHHRNHPSGKNEDGVHGVSLGFTSHYQAMQQRFGPHLTVGCAGENIIVEVSRRVEPTEAMAGLLILDRSGRAKGRLVNVVIARPCKPFTGFALGEALADPEVFKESLQFLDGGTRGYYCTWEGEPAEIQIGDLVAVSTS